MAQFKDSLSFWGLQVAPKSTTAVPFVADEEALVHVTQARVRVSVELASPPPF